MNGPPEGTHAGDAERRFARGVRGQRVVEAVVVVVVLVIVFWVSVADHGDVTRAEATAAKERTAIRETLKGQKNDLNDALTQLAEVRSELEADREILRANGLPLAPAVTITNNPGTTTTTTTTAPRRPSGSSSTTTPNRPPGTTQPTTAPPPPSTPPTTSPPPTPPSTLVCVPVVGCR